MLKKTLIATAITLASFGSLAAVVVITPSPISIEGAAGAATIGSPNVVVTLQAGYAVGDLLTFTVTGASLNTATPTLTHSNITRTAVADTPTAGAGGATQADVDAAAAGFPSRIIELGDVVTGITQTLGGDLTAGVLSRTATSVTFRVTAVTNNTTGTRLTLGGLELTTASTIDAVGNISVAYSAQTNTGTAIDNTGTLTDVSHTVANQFTATTTGLLDAVVDVEFARQQFVGNTNVLRNTDILVVTPVTNVDLAGGPLNAAYTGSTITIAGNFSWMDTDTTPGVSAAELAAAFNVNVSANDTMVRTINATGDLITVVISDEAGGVVGVPTMTFTNLGAGVGRAVLPTSTYTVNTTLRYTTAAAAPATVTLQTNAAAGEWTLNGAQALYNYVAVGYAGLQNTLTLSNSGTRSGAVVLEAFDEAGNTYGPVTLANELAPTSNMKISGDDIIESLNVPAGTKLSVGVIVNAPAEAIDFSGFTQVVGTGRQLMNVVVQD
ncbi:hypothetical protein GPUN_2884 [Glaciecola punicea ACAM 611]|uniref:Uncharacterized protein n=1 Tax=Glaciecola punicea ACAM 611 TaxID=1121923 RepID=H5TF71_9ALTE|nr:hypothetical protein [Glaciecola punicea]GAB56998.1 hypothetical protein GPUN_2884 [Glaciecola punicea ACAM 611]